MSFVAGILWSLGGAVAHSAIDLLRKLGAQRLQPVDLVALVAIYDAVIATAGVWSFEDGLPSLSEFPDLQIFSVVVVATCTCSVIARLLYQRALSVAPLSLTVPYMAFTPAFVVLMSPVFLVGEIPKPLGMLGVFIVSISALYSLTASLDKLGIAGAPNIWMYFLWQRLLIGGAGLLYLVCWGRGSIRYLVTAAPLIISISVVELAAVVFYFNAIQNLLVSYVVAIKRVNVLLSTLIGCVLFGEQVGRRIPYILVMLGGMLLIVLQPGHEDLHHSHHTRRLLLPQGPRHMQL
eukprot:gene12587-12718_t